MPLTEQQIETISTSLYNLLSSRSYSFDDIHMIIKSLIEKINERRRNLTL